MFRRPKLRRARRSFDTSLSAVEGLEQRTLLSAAAAPVIDLSAIEVDESSYDSSRLIVKWKSPTHVANTTALASILGHGAASRAISPLVAGLQTITLPESVDVHAALNAFRNNPLVEYASLDYQIRIASVPNDPQFASMWDHENTGQSGGVIDADIDATAAWQVHTGSHNTVVAVIDTGVDWSHPDLDDNMWINIGEIYGNGIDDDGNGYVDDYYGYDFINRDGNPMDDQGHGTHVAGTIGAEGNNGIGIAGINWNVRLMALKFLGADGAGSSSHAIEAILYAVNNGAHVINASWGGDPFSQALYDAIATARDAGVIFVAAAGNGDFLGRGINNDAVPFFPSGYELDNIIAVAATDHTDSLGTFSNYGATTVDIAAPGVNILSTTRGGGYGLNTGTSMAAPHVAGVVALVRDLHPDWTYSQIIAAVLNNVDVLPQLNGLVSTGGRLNAGAALGNPAPPEPPAPPVSMPFLEDFGDGLAQGFDLQSGRWSVSGGRYHADPVVSDDNRANVATVRLAGPMVSNFEIHATINADEGYLEIFGLLIRDYLTNGFLVFDFVSTTDFKFAGVDIDADQWVIGRRDASGWHIDAFANEVLNAGTNYALTLRVTQGKQVALLSNGVEKISYQYTQAVTNGGVGLGSRNSLTHFDNVVVHEYWNATDGALPLFEDFEDGIADHIAPELGIGGVVDGRFLVGAFDNGIGASLIRLASPLPDKFDFAATFNANDSSATQLSNAFLIFDYQSATDFKFAGAYLGSDQWLIGRRTSSGWATDAYVTRPIDPLTDYDLRLVIETSGKVTLFADDVELVSHVYAGSLDDGALGLGTRDAMARFDNVSVTEYVPPPPATLPYAENFDDGKADGFSPVFGTAFVIDGRYEITAVPNGNGVALLTFDELLPDELEIAAIFNANDSTATELSNAFIVFDYQSGTDFKFAGTYLGSDQWLIGRRTSSGWATDAYVNRTADPLVDYELRVVLRQDGKVTLFSGDLELVSHVYSDVLTDGAIGVGTRDAVARFDDVTVNEFVPPPPVTLPYAENFDDGIPNAIVAATGTGTVINGRYEIVAVPNGNGTALLSIAGPLPDELDFSAVFNANAGTTTELSNAFLIFDYQNPTDYKFAGAYLGSGQWLIGRKVGSQWVTDASVMGSLEPLTDYDVRIVIEPDGKVTLFSNGQALITHQYGDSLTDGALGLGTRDAVARFDDVALTEYTPSTSFATVPLAENFDTGVPDFVSLKSGGASHVNGRYQIAGLAGGDGVATVGFTGSVPADLEILATINVDGAFGAFQSNGFLIFDYVDATNFKFAGAFAGADQWAIGHRDSSGWVTDVFVNSRIDPLVDYQLRLVLEANGRVTLSADGIDRVTFDFGTTLTDGQIGFGTNSAVARFDDLAVHQYVPPPTLFEENFDDGTADDLSAVSGQGTVSDARYEVVANTNGDGVSLVQTPSGLPSHVEFSATFNADAATPGRFSNAFLIFDYHSPTDFKFAGAYLGSGQWLIGHRTASGWITDRVVTTGGISAGTDYRLKLEIDSDGVARLFSDGVLRVSYDFGSSLTDGSIGVGTRNANARFDDVLLRDLSPPSMQLQSLVLADESLFEELLANERSHRPEAITALLREKKRR